VRSPLADVPGIGMVSSFPIESMHEIYLGVGKFLVRSITGDRGKTDGVKRGKNATQTETGDDADAHEPHPNAFIGKRELRILDWRVGVVSKFRPKELARNIRPLKDVRI